MSRTRRLAVTAVLPVLVAAGIAAPGAALAKGGGSNAPPPPSVQPVQCDYTLDRPTVDGGYVFSNQVNDAGCISVIQLANALRLYTIALTPGWTYVVNKNRGG